MSKYDKILIGAVFVLAMLSYLAVLLVSRDRGLLAAEISVDGNVFATIDLNDPMADRLISIPGPLGTSIAEAKPGAIRMKSSPCPDHICTKTGWIERPGQVIACVPNRVIIKVFSDKNSVDSISH